MRITSQNDLDELKALGLATLYPDRMKITFGYATCGIANGATPAMRALAAAAEAEGLDAVVATTGCLGYCQAEPLVDVWTP